MKSVWTGGRILQWRGHENDTCYKPRLSHWTKAPLLGKPGLSETWQICYACTLFVPLPCCQKILAVFCLHPEQNSFWLLPEPGFWAWLLPYPKRDSICVLKSEPQSLGSSSISTVEHMRDSSDEITLQYIYKFTEIDWKWMLGSRKNGGKSSSSPGSDLKDCAALGNKIKISQTCKHLSGSCWSHRFYFSIFFGQSGERKLVIVESPQNRKYFVLATDLLCR